MRQDLGATFRAAAVRNQPAVRRLDSNLSRFLSAGEITRPKTRGWMRITLFMRRRTGRAYRPKMGTCHRNLVKKRLRQAPNRTPEGRLT